jgi:hypothetical protein
LRNVLQDAPQVGWFHFNAEYLAGFAGDSTIIFGGGRISAPGRRI